MTAGNPLSMQVLEALARGDKLGAIKLMREAGAPNLRAALQAIEAQASAASQARKLGPPALPNGAPARPAMQPRTPTVAMGDPPGQLRWLLVVVALLVAAAWIAFGGRM